MASYVSTGGSHYHREILQFILQHGKSAAGHFDTARSVQCCRLRNPIATAHQENYKAVLQQYAQKVLAATPLYELLDEKGPDHSKCFEVCVTIDGRRFSSAWGPNKKTSEQKAALLALEELGVFPHEEVNQAIEQMATTTPMNGNGGGD